MDRRYDVVVEAERLLEQLTASPNALTERWVEFSYRYEEALDNEDWKLALYYFTMLYEIELTLRR